MFPLYIDVALNVMYREYNMSSLLIRRISIYPIWKKALSDNESSGAIGTRSIAHLILELFGTPTVPHGALFQIIL